MTNLNIAATSVNRGDVLVILTLVSAINAIDRQIVAVLSEAIRRELGISDMAQASTTKNS